MGWATDTDCMRKSYLVNQIWFFGGDERSYLLMGVSGMGTSASLEEFRNLELNSGQTKSKKMASAIRKTLRICQRWGGLVS